MKFTTEAINELLNGELIGPKDIVITHPSGIEDAGEGAITFLANPKYLHFLNTTKASAVLVSKDLKLDGNVTPALIKVDNVYLALSKLLGSLGIGAENPEGISHLSSIHKEATIGGNVAIGEFTVIERGVKVSRNTTIFSQVYIGKNVKIGENCIIYPGVKIYHDCTIGDNCIIHCNSVIGVDGFGFAIDGKGEYHKIPQIGNVTIENDVEIGANVVIDRATMGSTLVQKGVKLDNLIQIAHNVKIGANTVIAAQTGIAGSAIIGKNVVMGGQVGVAGHLKVSDRTQIQGQSGIASNIDVEGRKMYGYPAIDYRQYLKSYAVFKKLPEMARELEELRKELSILKKK